MTLHIIGAGMAGLLAANILRRHEPAVYEGQGQLPNNHAALLRFRTSKVADELGIEFKSVNMIKTAVPWINPVADALAYSRKCNGVARSDRSILNTGLEVQRRWIAPANLVELMAKNVNVQYNTVVSSDIQANNLKDQVISTMPMPMLMDLLDYPNKPEFRSRPGWVLSVEAPDCEAYATVYFPNPDDQAYRVSVTGNLVQAEYIREEPVDSPYADMLKCLDYLGLEMSFEQVQKETSIKPQKYAKILPIDEEIRRHFIHWATEKFGIFSLGRFATWRPGLLLDDLVNDCSMINRWVRSNSLYSARLQA